METGVLSAKKRLSCSDKDEELARQEVLRMHESALMPSWIVVAR